MRYRVGLSDVRSIIYQGVEFELRMRQIAVGKRLAQPLQVCFPQLQALLALPRFGIAVGNARYPADLYFVKRVGRPVHLCMLFRLSYRQDAGEL